MSTLDELNSIFVMCLFTRWIHIYHVIYQWLKSVGLQVSVVSAVLSPAAWPVPAHSLAICEGLEDWGVATDLSNLSDSDEEDQPAPLVRFCHCHVTGRAAEIVCCYVSGDLWTSSIAAIPANIPQQGSTKLPTPRMHVLPEPRVGSTCLLMCHLSQLGIGIAFQLLVNAKLVK